MVRKQAVLAILLASILLALAPAAWAGPVDIQILWPGSIGTGVAISSNSGGTYTTVFAGTLKIQVGSTTTFGYCVDLEHTIEWNTPYPADLVSTSSVPPSGNYDLAKAAWLLNTYGGSLPTLDHHVALQLAIWNALYDNDSDVGNAGSFRSNASANVVSIANAMLAALYAAGYSGSQAILIDTEDIAGTTYTQNFIITPEPTALVLLGTGMLALALVRRRQH